MYYEEKLINGIWHWRGLPTEEFKRMDEHRLRGKIDRMQQQLTEANRRGEELAANLQYYYKNDLCKAAESSGKDCLCWHDLPVPDGIKAKLRIKPATSKRDK